MILRISKIVIASLFGFASAFIITALITSARQKQVNEDAIVEPYQNTMPSGSNKYSGIIKLVIGESGFCSGVVIDGIYALTAAHCVKDTLGSLTSDKILILDMKDTFTGIVAEPVAIDNLRDIALIKGDFSDFGYFELADSPGSGAVISCGYPSGGDLFCSTFLLKGNYEFRLLGAGGILYMGQSGGPVFNFDNKVVAVNSAVRETDVLFAPVTGALEIFGIK